MSCSDLEILIFAQVRCGGRNVPSFLQTTLGFLELRSSFLLCPAPCTDWRRDEESLGVVSITIPLFFLSDLCYSRASFG